MAFVLHEMDGLLLIKMKPSSVKMAYEEGLLKEYQRVFRTECIDTPARRYSSSVPGPDLGVQPDDADDEGKQLPGAAGPAGDGSQFEYERADIAAQAERRGSDLPAGGGVGAEDVGCVSRWARPLLHFRHGVRIEHIAQHTPSFRPLLPYHQVFARADEVIARVELLISALLRHGPAIVPIPVQMQAEWHELQGWPSAPKDGAGIEDVFVLLPVYEAGRGKGVEEHLLIVLGGIGRVYPVSMTEDGCFGIGIPAGKDGVAGGSSLCGCDGLGWSLSPGRCQQTKGQKYSEAGSHMSHA